MSNAQTGPSISAWNQSQPGRTGNSAKAAHGVEGDQHQPRNPTGGAKGATEPLSRTQAQPGPVRKAPPLPGHGRRRPCDDLTR